MSDVAYTDREYALMEALRDALSMLTPKQAFAESGRYDSLYVKTLPLDVTAVSSLRTLPEIGAVTIDPDYDCPGAVEYEADGTPSIVLREYDERVLLHECIHAIFAREGEARSALSSDQEERIIRHLTRALYVSGWRLRVTDRSIAQVEHELNETARQRDALAREIDGGGTRDYTYGARG